MIAWMRRLIERLLGRGNSDNIKHYLDSDGTVPRPKNSNPHCT